MRRVVFHVFGVVMALAFGLASFAQEPVPTPSTPPPSPAPAQTCALHPLVR